MARVGMSAWKYDVMTMNSPVNYTPYIARSGVYRAKGKDDLAWWILLASRLPNGGSIRDWHKYV